MGMRDCLFVMNRLIIHSSAIYVVDSLFILQKKMSVPILIY